MGKPDLIVKTATFLAKDEEDQQVITVLAKGTFDWSPQGRLQPSPEPLDFIENDELKAKETEPGYYPVAEIELLPYKLKTDVIVTGEVVAPGEKPVAQMTAEVHIGAVSKTIAVFGNRMVETHDCIHLHFSRPEPFVRLPLSYTLAYGGVDPSVPRNEDPQTVGEWAEYLTLEQHPGVYPRNPVGQAYVVNAHKWLLNERPLPNFEDPLDLLTPERMIVNQPENWWRQPMPAGLGWYARNWYPRCVFGGMLPPFLPDQASVKETALGLMAQDHISAAQQRELADTVDPAFFNGASPGLAVPHLRGDEPVRLVGLHPAGEVAFQLPGMQPEFAIWFEGKPLEASVHIHTVWIETDKHKLSIIWSANARPPRILPKTLPTREQPVVDELEDVLIRVNGQEVPHEPMDLGKVPI